MKDLDIDTINKMVDSWKPSIIPAPVPVPKPVPVPRSRPRSYVEPYVEPIRKIEPEIEHPFQMIQKAKEKEEQEARNKYLKEATEIENNLSQKVKILAAKGNSLMNKTNASRPDQTKIAQLILAKKQLEQIEEMNWRQALNKKNSRGL